MLVLIIVVIKIILDKIKAGWVDVDKIIATPDMMAELGKLGKILRSKRSYAKSKKWYCYYGCC